MYYSQYRNGTANDTDTVLLLQAIKLFLTPPRVMPGNSDQLAISSPTQINGDVITDNYVSYTTI